MYGWGFMCLVNPGCLLTCKNVKLKTPKGVCGGGEVEGLKVVALIKSLSHKNPLSHSFHILQETIYSSTTQLMCSPHPFFPLGVTDSILEGNDSRGWLFSSYREQACISSEAFRVSSNGGE